MKRTYKEILKEYDVDKKGNIFHNGKKLSVQTYSNKYRYFGIRTDGTKHNYSIHRLVAVKYIPNPKNLPEVNHIDGNKSNNNVNNLEWVTKSQNQQHAIKTGLNLNGNKITLVNTRTLENKLFNSAYEASLWLGRACDYIRGRLRNNHMYTANNDYLIVRW